MLGYTFDEDSSTSQVESKALSQSVFPDQRPPQNSEVSAIKRKPFQGVPSGHEQLILPRQLFKTRIEHFAGHNGFPMGSDLNVTRWEQEKTVF